MCALMYSTLMTLDIWLTEHLDHILSSGDTLYQQSGICGELLVSYIPTYMFMCNCQLKVSEKQSVIS